MLPANPLLNATAPAGPHLPAATLRQYAAGTLAPAARHRVEAHTLACPRCADVLEGLLQTPAATTDQALAQLQQRLRRRVQQTESARPVAARTRPTHRWVVLQLAAAATLLFGLVVGGWWTWQQRHTAPVAVATQPAPTFPAPAAAPATGAPEVVVPAARVAAATSLRPVPKAASVAARHPVSAQRSRPLSAPLPVPSGRTAVLPATSDEAADERVSQPAAPAVASEPGGRPATAPPDSATASQRLAGKATEAAQPPAAPAALVRDRAMPAMAPIPPAPVGGYAAWREKIRHEATEFKPEEPERPVSGSVQLRLLIGADGKIQEIRVLHGLRADYDEEAQRLVCDGPGWVPGIGGGKRAAQVVDVAVPFQ